MPDMVFQLRLARMLAADSGVEGGVLTRHTLATPLMPCSH